MRRHLTFAVALLLGVILFCGVGEAYAIAEPAVLERRGGYECTSSKPTCPPVTITKTIRKRPKQTIVLTTTPKHCPTATSTSAEHTTSSLPTSGCSFCGGCARPTAVPVTKTIDWEDIDGLAASRVPIPDNYQGFSHYNPDQNKVYRSGPPPVSVGNGVQVAYANDGKFGLGALGFVIEWKSFWVLTFLDPANGITQATLRVSGLLVSTLIVPITVDRQFVQIVAPTTGSSTAVGFFIEVFAGPDVTGPRLPFWLDDFVYVRNLWPATCCQQAGTYTTLDFNNLTPNGAPIPFPYENFDFQGPWTPVTLPEHPAQGTVLHYPSAPQPASITSPTPFSLTRLSIFIPQGTNPGLQMKHTVVTLTGHDALGNEIELGWTVASVTFQAGPVKLDFGGDWTQGGAGSATGYFAATGGFTGIRELRIKVEETDYTGPPVGLPFWLDDFQYQAGC